MTVDFESYLRRRAAEPGYPERYEPGDLNISLALRFEDREGRIFTAPDLKVTAGAQGTWSIRVLNNEADIPAGGAFHFISLNYSFAHRIQVTDPARRDYATLETDSRARLDLAAEVPGYYNLCRVYVTEGVFRRGEEFTLRLGDRRHGSVGAEVYWTTTQAALVLGVDLAGDGTLAGIKGDPRRFEVVAENRPRFLRLLGPTVVEVGRDFDLLVGVHDRNGNPIPDYAGTVHLAGAPGVLGLPGECVFTPPHEGTQVLAKIRLDRPGVFRLAARADGLDRECRSNPIVASSGPAKKIYWGDLHAHGWGDCSMHLMHLRTAKTDPLARHRQARLGRLDFAAIGPMSYPRTGREEIWQAYREACREMDRPGEYVPFLSYEAHPLGQGDRTVIFARLDEPLPPDYGVSLAELDRLYGRRDVVFLEVHIGGETPKWDVYRPTRERMVEVASGFGNAEWLLVKALQLGYKPAICGCSDLHLGLMGGPRAVETARGRFGRLLNQRDAAYGTGPLTAAIADELTREGIWEALANRSTYATSGARIYLDFSCNGAPGGSEIRKEKEIRIALRCHGTAEIEEIALIAGGYCLRTWRPDRLDLDLQAEFKEEEVPGDWLYLRVRQVDGNYAWTAPLWFAPAYPRWDETEPPVCPGRDEAARHLADVLAYLQQEEDFSLFKEVMPVGLVDQGTAVCALFRCYYGDRHQMSIRWYFEFPIPKIRLDWGWKDYGVRDDEVAFRLR